LGPHDTGTRMFLSQRKVPNLVHGGIRHQASE
jgi:hypothetical protein